MTTDEKLESLIQQASELPDEAQQALFESLVEMRLPHLGIDIGNEGIDSPNDPHGV
jgi:hypothetical protein